jgi:hypothetical protein
MGQCFQYASIFTQSQVAQDEEEPIQHLRPARFRDQLPGIRSQLTNIIACPQHGAVTDLSQRCCTVATWPHSKEPGEAKACDVGFTLCERELPAAGPVDCA